MNQFLNTFFGFLLISSAAWADHAPWQNPQINEINREPIHAHFIPYTNETNALHQRNKCPPPTGIASIRTFFCQPDSRTTYHSEWNLEIPVCQKRYTMPR